MSKETFYFSHDYNARNDIKIQALLVEHGAIGYGVYWIIVEILHEESEKKLKLDDMTYVAIARQASTSVEQAKAIVECCLKYELFTEDDGYFFSKRILKNIEKRMSISEKRAKAGRVSAIKRKKGTLVEQNPTSVEESPTSVEENPTCVQQHPTKERKGKERKEKEIKVKDNTNTNTVCVFNFKKSLLEYGFEPLLVDEWMAIRKTKKAINSEFSFNSFISQVEKTGAEKNEVMRLIAEKQWAGFNHAWMKNTNNNLNTFENETDRRNRESAQRKQEIYEYARSVGMVGSEEKRDIADIW